MSHNFRKFLQASPSPFHATKQLKDKLLQAGFTELFETQVWSLKAKASYFITRNDSSIIAFYYPSKKALLEGIHMSGAHTDSPALKIKPSPLLAKAGVKQLSVEVYGGALLNPWFDRDLSIAGRVHFKDTKGSLESELIDFKRPVAFIPSLAIHLDRDANSNKSINAQKDLPAVISLADDSSFHDILKKELQSNDIAEILSFDLVLYDVQAPSVVGLDEAFIASARLDNLLSCYAGLEALVSSDKDKASLIVFNDHEEVGSVSTSGAQGNFLEIVLQRLLGSTEDFARVMAKSLMVSTDNAHALHPNFSDIHEPEHAPLMGQGVAVKFNANQAYATDSESAAIFTNYAHKAGKKLQSYVVRSDTRCGSTIGPITATKLGLKTIDIGVPTWAMHSIRETAAYSDIVDLIDILRSYFNKE